jgi:hypothetical protein
VRADEDFTLAPSASGVGVKAMLGRDYYFTTTAIGEVLQALRSADFSASDEPEVPSKIWNPTP